MAFPYPYVGPYAPYNNVPIEPQYFQPSRFVISAITLGKTTTVTTSVNHNYVVGQEVRLLIPSYYGSFQLNEQTGLVTSIPAVNQVVLNINSIGSNAFIPSPSYGPTPPQIIAIGEINSGQINSSGRVNNITYIPGSFINISPN
jgi:hypothetical protein